MKKLILLFAVVFVAFQLEAQAVKQKDVPEIVIQQLESWYPGVSKVKWEMNDGMYQASFLMHNLKNEVVFSKEGAFSSAEAEMHLAELPEAVQAYLAEHFPNTTFEEIEMEMDAKGVVTYSVEAGDTEYIISADGKLLSQESDDDSDDDDK